MADENEKPKVQVSADALYKVLSALNGQAHYIRELQVTRGLPGDDNPIDILIHEYNEWANVPPEPEAPPES